jgi:small subunit ribosomal protein S6
VADEKVLIDLSAASRRQRHYETVFIISPALNETQVSEITDRLNKALIDAGATMLRQDNWGKKRMAYMINKHAMGNYFYYRFAATVDAVHAFERLLKLEAAVLRLMTVKLSEPLSAEEIKALAEKAPREQSAAPALRMDSEDSFDAAL